MRERHEHEQYFFDPPTLAMLADELESYLRPCCLCAPLVGKVLVERGTDVAILDIDDRFSNVSGFRRYDLLKPEFLPERFGVIFCDPPFFGVSLSDLYRAIALLSHHDFEQPLALAYVNRRAEALLRRFAPFNLRATGRVLGYETVETSLKTTVELYSNFG